MQGKAELQMSSLFQRRTNITSLPLYHSGHLLKKRIAEKVRAKTESEKPQRVAVTVTDFHDLFFPSGV